MRVEITYSEDVNEECDIDHHLFLEILDFGKDDVPRAIELKDTFVQKAYRLMWVNKTLISVTDPNYSPWVIFTFKDQQDAMWFKNRLVD